MIGYSFTKHADRELRKLPLAVQRRMIKKLEHALLTGSIFALTERLTGVSGIVYRLRVGDYRLVFDRTKDGLVVLAVGHRRDVYRKLPL